MIASSGLKILLTALVAALLHGRLHFVSNPGVHAAMLRSSTTFSDGTRKEEFFFYEIPRRTQIQCILKLTSTDPRITGNMDQATIHTLAVVLQDTIHTTSRMVINPITTLPLVPGLVTIQCIIRILMPTLLQVEATSLTM
jgi:hypothetical protein